MKNFNIPKLLTTLFAAAIFLTGCMEPTEAYTKFVTEHGTAYRYYCDKDTGFFMNEYIKQRWDTSFVEHVTNDLEQPVRCGPTEIAVIETSSGTKR